MKAIITSIFMILALVANVNAQYSMGLVADDSSYNAQAKKQFYLKRDYTSLPKFYSLKKYCPTPRSQGSYSTCTAWATTYAARTLVEAKGMNLTAQTEIDKLAFSPGYVFKFAKYESEITSCNSGVFVDRALQVLIDKGAPYFYEYNVLCSANDQSIYSYNSKAEKHKIKSYVPLFESYDERNKKIETTKKALAEGNPVIIGMKCPYSFYDATDEWIPTENPDGNFGLHAMCVIGYDDNFKGKGGFELMNSWGTDWGNKGFTYISYENFAKFTPYAYELIPFETKSVNNVYSVNSNVKLIDFNNKNLSVKETSKTGEFIATNYFNSGDKFKVYINSDQQSYVYIIGSDLSNSIEMLYPKSNTSALLNYKNATIPFPAENEYIQFDQNKGQDVLCVIFSERELNTKDLEYKLKATKLSLPEAMNAEFPKSGSTKYINSTSNGLQIKNEASKSPVEYVIIYMNHV